MISEWGWFFGAWLFLWLIVEFLTTINVIPKQVWKIPHTPLLSFVLLLLIFIPFEIRGAINNIKGDTFSEFIWSFIGKHHHARSIVGIAIGMALPARAATLPMLFQGNSKTIVRILPWWLLCAGILGWLVQHFPELGREG